MNSGPAAKKHCNCTCCQDIKSTTSIRTRLPVHYVGAIAEYKRAHSADTKIGSDGVALRTLAR